MAVLALQSVQEKTDYRGRPTDEHGKLRIQYFELEAVAVAGDIGSTVDLCTLPPGAIRILPLLSMLQVSAFGASRTLSVGHRAYQKRDNPGEAYEAESANAFINARDVSSATFAAFSAAVLKYDVYSKQGVKLFATVAGGTIPVNATIKGYVIYIAE